MKTYLPLLMVLLLSACARPPAPLWTDVPSTEMLIDKLSSRSGAYSTFDAATSVSITTEGRYLSSQQFIMVESPDRVRVDALTGFGQLIMQLATDGDVLSVFMNTTSPPRFYRGNATMENFSRFVRLPLPPEFLVAILLHDPPVLDYEKALVYSKNGNLELHLVAGSFLQIFHFDGQFQLIGTEYHQNQDVLFSVDYSRFSAVDGFPRRIELQIPPEDATLAMRINDLVLNADIPAARFVLQTPDGVTPEPIP